MARITHYAAVILLVLGTLVSCQNSDGADPGVTTDQPTKPTPAPPQPAPPKPDPKTTAFPETTVAPTDPPTEPPTTAAPTTAAPAPTPAPEDDSFYNVTRNNVTCIMIDGDFSFSVALDNVTGTVSIPKHDAVATGTCNGTDGDQSITLTWGKSKNSATMVFSMAKNMWNVSSYSAELVLDGSDFTNTTLSGKKLSVLVDLVMSPVSVSVNHSYSCISQVDAGADATLDGAQSNITVKADMDGMHVQAFNMIANEPDFVDATHCSADETSDIVPIAVGCALAGLVVIVLIAYLVGRRRRSAAYQSV